MSSCSTLTPNHHEACPKQQLSNYAIHHTMMGLSLHASRPTNRSFHESTADILPRVVYSVFQKNGKCPRMRVVLAAEIGRGSHEKRFEKSYCAVQKLLSRLLLSSGRCSAVRACAARPGS
jgi:hypothetical protein